MAPYWPSVTPGVPDDRLGDQRFGRRPSGEAGDHHQLVLAQRELGGGARVAMREAADARRRPGEEPVERRRQPRQPRVGLRHLHLRPLSRDPPRVSRTHLSVVRRSVRTRSVGARDGAARHRGTARAPVTTPDRPTVQTSTIAACRRAHPGAVPDARRADRAVWLPWMLRVTWIAIAAVGWPAVTSAVSDRSDARRGRRHGRRRRRVGGRGRRHGHPGDRVVDGDARDRAVGTGCRPRRARRRRRHGGRSRDDDRRRAGDARRDVGRVRQAVRAGIGVRRRGTPSAASPARVRRRRRPRLDGLGRRADRRPAAARGAGVDTRRRS